MPEDDSLRNLVNASGFPFQLAIEKLIEDAQCAWTRIVVEHAWNHREAGTSGFIDLVLEQGLIRLVVECKRARDGQWVFLNPAHPSSRRVETFWIRSTHDRLLSGWTGLFFIRFFKNLTTRLVGDLQPRNLADMNRARNRTVFVVNADHLVERSEAGFS